MGSGEEGGGAVLYCDTCPCLTCSIKIAQVGVKEVVYAMGYSMDRETAEVFREAGVKLRQFVPVGFIFLLLASSRPPPPPPSSLSGLVSSNMLLFSLWVLYTLTHLLNLIIACRFYLKEIRHH